ncbi:MAG: TIGR03943 family protein [Verrucomicrobiota bacterium]
MKKYKYRLVVLLAWIGLLSYHIVAGSYINFLRHDLLFLLIAGWVILMGCLVVSLFRAIKPLDARSNTCCNEHRETWLQCAILVSPLLFIASAHDLGLGSHALEKRMTQFKISELDNARVTIAPSPAKPHGITSNSDRPSLDIRAVCTHPKQWIGQAITTWGQVYNKPEAIGENRILLFQFLITCCAADAIPMGILVESPEAQSYTNDTWLIATGKVTIIKHNDYDVVCILADKLKEIQRPSNPYLYRGLESGPPAH